MFNFEFSPSAITEMTVVAMIFAAVIFVVVPVVLGAIEYRLTKKHKRGGFYLMLGVFVSAVLLGLYSLFVGLLLLVVYLLTASRGMKSTTQTEV